MRQDVGPLTWKVISLQWPEPICECFGADSRRKVDRGNIITEISRVYLDLNIQPFLWGDMGGSRTSHRCDLLGYICEAIVR